MNRYGLIGYPLGHSFSKKYFTEKFEKEGLRDSVFELFPIASINELPDLLKKHPDLKGLSVTIPYKRSVMDFLHESNIPSEIEACNSIRIHNGHLTGYNTDAIGFEKSFAPLLQPQHQAALILGNGGATAAVSHVLHKLSIPFHIVSRALHGNSTLTYADLNADVITAHQIIINATPLGTFPAVEDCPPIPYNFIGKSHLLFDLVYNPAETLFLRNGRERGASIQNGYEMLVHQAEASWALWNN